MPAASSTLIRSTRVDYCLKSIGLHVAGFYLNMEQRPGLATALLGEPQRLLVDEPINGLDPEEVSWVRHIVRALADAGRCVLVSSHL